MLHDFKARRSACLKVLANEDTLLPTHCCRHIVADTNVSPFARARNICCGHKFCVRDTKNVSDFGQKHFVSATNVSQFAQHAIHHEQQCVRNNVSSFASTFREERRPDSRKRRKSSLVCMKLLFFVKGMENVLIFFIAGNGRK